MFNLWVVQQVGQDPQQGGGRGLHAGSKRLSCRHQDVVVSDPLLTTRGLLTLSAVRLPLQQSIQEVMGVTVTQRGLERWVTEEGSYLRTTGVWTGSGGTWFTLCSSSLRDSSRSLTVIQSFSLLRHLLGKT